MIGRVWSPYRYTALTVEGNRSTSALRWLLSLDGDFAAEDPSCARPRSARSSIGAGEITFLLYFAENRIARGPRLRSFPG